MQTFKNCAEIKIKSYRVKFSNTFNQSLLKISSFDLHTGLQMCVPLFYFQESFSSSAGQRSPTQCLRECLISGAGNITHHQTTPTSLWWHTLPAAISTACLPDWMCFQNVEAVSAGRLVRHETYHWQCSNKKCCILQGNVATLLRCGGNLYIHFVENFIILQQWKILKSVKIWQSYCQNSTLPLFWQTVREQMCRLRDSELTLRSYLIRKI